MNHTRLLPLACAVGVGLAACEGAADRARASADDLPGAPDGASSRPVRFSDRVAPLAEQRCDGCHAGAPGGPMAVYRNARAFITPGKPEDSLYYVLPNGHPPAWGDAADLVRAWIAAGAPE